MNFFVFTEHQDVIEETYSMLLSCNYLFHGALENFWRRCNALWQSAVEVSAKWTDECSEFGWSSSSSGICQNPLVTFNLVKMVDPFSLWRMSSTVSKTYLSHLITEWCSAFCSQCWCAPHRLSLVLSQYSLRTSICSMMPVSSIFSSSSFTFCKRGISTLLAVSACMVGCHLWVWFSQVHRHRKLFLLVS